MDAMPKIRLVTNVSEYGLLGPLARTRGRLIASALLATVVTIGLGLASASYVLDSSASVLTNLAIITFNMMLMLVAAYLQTVLVGDLFFSDGWRQKVILGDTKVEGPVKDHNAEFMVILMLAVVANALIVNYGSGGFLDRYHQEGFFEARMRSDVAAERLDAMQELADPMNYDIWSREAIHDVLVGGLDDPDPAVREHVVWNAGELEVVRARDSLIEIVLDTEESAEIRAEAAVALGKLGTSESARLALEELVVKSEDDTVVIGAMRGLALMESQLSTKPILTRVKQDLDSEVGINGLFALRTLQNPEIRPWLREELEKTETKKTRCALLDTLKLVANEEDVTWGRLRFSRAAQEEGCDAVIWEERNERQHYIMYGDSFRVKFLKIVANASGVKQEAWFQRIVADPNETWRVREVANEVILGIKRARGEL